MNKILEEKRTEFCNEASQVLDVIIDNNDIPELIYTHLSKKLPRVMDSSFACQSYDEQYEQLVKLGAYFIKSEHLEVLEQRGILARNRVSSFATAFHAYRAEIEKVRSL